VVLFGILHLDFSESLFIGTSVNRLLLCLSYKTYMLLDTGSHRPNSNKNHSFA
jgi:hypothetical protein